MDHHGHQQHVGSEKDRISDLPDDLLQGILLHLCSTTAAARTSVLSRRWRHVWASIPDLVLADDVIHHRASFLDTVDAALVAYTAGPAVRLRALVIMVPDGCHNVPADRVSAWLLFASRRLAGELHLRVPLSGHDPPQGEIELPPSERATRMTLVLGDRFVLLPPPTGVFAALADLDIRLATMDARVLEGLISTQCPCLENLTLLVVTPVNDSELSISSASLRRLVFWGLKTRRLNVAAPNLQELCACFLDDVRVAAPNLAELVSSSIGQLVFAEAVRHLRRLEVIDWSRMASSSLLRQLDTVDELRLHVPFDEVEFKRFMDGTNNLPLCETLSVSFSWHNAHHPVPTMLHLLRRGSRIKKLVVSLEHSMAADRCSLACPCRSPESTMAHGIILDSLEEIKFRLIEKGDEYMQVLKRLLSISNLRKLQNVQIDVLYQRDAAASLSNDDDNVYQTVREICPPNIGVKVNQN